MTISDTWASFITEAKYQDLPKEVINKAKETLLDTIGVALAAFNEFSTISAHKAASNWGTGNISLWGFKEGSSVIGASIVNGTMSHTFDYDDTHRRDSTRKCLHYSRCNGGRRIKQ